MVRNGQKWSKMVKMVKNGQNGLKSSKMVQNGPNGQKWKKIKNHIHVEIWKISVEI